jgi:hypothetical protein
MTQIKKRNKNDLFDYFKRFKKMIVEKIENETTEFDIQCLIDDGFLT